MNEFDLEHLLKNHKVDLTSKKFLPGTNDFKNFINLLTPFSGHIHHSIPHLFLSQVIDQRQLNTEKTWLVRDGLIPLVWFFLNNPKPKSKLFKLFIPEILSLWVPDAWTDQISTYNLIYHRANKQQNNSLLIVGLNSSVFFSKPSWQTHLKKISQIIEKESVESVDIYLPFRWFPSDKEDTFHCSSTESLLRSLKIPHHFISLKEMLRTTVGSHAYRACYLPNDGIFLWLDAITHHLIKNQQVVIKDKDEKNIIRDPLSPSFVDYEIEPPKHLGSRFKELEKFNLLDLANSISKSSRYEEKFYFPWPNWFGVWLNKYSETIDKETRHSSNQTTSVI